VTAGSHLFSGSKVSDPTRIHFDGCPYRFLFLAR